MSTRSIRISDVIVWLAALCVLVVCGAASYEHAVVVPAWTANPPESLSMLHGPYALQHGEHWWRLVHLPTIIMVIAASVFIRNQRRESWRLVRWGLAIYGVVLLTTLLWFVPELLAITTDPGANIPLVEWKYRADRWEILSLLRLALMFFFGVTLLRAISEPPSSV